MLAGKGIGSSEAMASLLLLLSWLVCVDSYLPSAAISASRPSRGSLSSAFLIRDTGSSSSSSSSSSSAGRDSPVYRDDDLLPYEELSSLVQKVKREDAEWLRSVFGTSLDDLLPLQEGEATSEENGEDNGATNIDNKSEKEEDEEEVAGKEEEEEEDLSEWAEMATLGYSKEDISDIKPSVRVVIIERAVQRPRKELPRKWLRTGEGGRPVIGAAAPRAAPPSGKSNSGVGSSVAWSGKPLNAAEERAAAQLREKSRDINRSLRRASDGPSSSVYEGEDGPPSFWPGKKEFQDMLIDESKWRIDLIGGWSTPFIRAETKWRYGLYKNWLTFLDEGIGDGYDVVPGSFPSQDGEGYEEEVDGAFESTPNPVRRAPAASAAARKPPRRRAAGAQSQSRQAASYERWVRRELGSAERSWTDLKTEERASTRALREGGRTERISRSSEPSASWFERSEEEEEEEEWDDEEEGDEGEGGYERQEDFDRAWSDSMNRREVPAPRRVFREDDE